MKRIVAFLIFFFGLTLAANAGPIAAAVGAIAGAFGSIAAAGGIGAALLKLGVGLAINFGVSLIQRALAPDRPATKPAGIKTSIQIGGNNPLAFIVGRYGTAGQLEYANTWGEVDKTPNAYLTMVISLSDIPVIGLTNNIWVDGQSCNIDTNDTSFGFRGYPVPQFYADDKHHMWVKFHDGKQSIADPFLVDVFGSDPDRPWTNDMIGRGVAYAIVTVLINRELFSGIPGIKFEVDGIRLYDPRRDSTNGGSGTQRWNNPATWTTSGYNNPAVIRYNIIRGIYYGSQWVYGGQNLAQALLPSASWIAAANEDDLPIGIVAGGTEPQFRGGAEIDVDIEPLTMLEEFNKGANGRIAEIAGYYKVKDGNPGVSVYAFTDDDIVITDESSFDPFPSFEEIFNGAQASYPEPAEGWEMKDAPPFYNAAFQDDDGGRELVAPLQYLTVPYNRQVQRLIRAAVQAERRFRTHVLVLPPDAWLIEPNDVVSWSSERNGYVNKDFIVEAITGKRGTNQIVSLRETDPTDYDWNPATDEKEYSIAYVGAVYPPAQPMSGWTVQPAIFYDSVGNSRRPSIEVFYDGDNSDIRATRVQVRLASSGDIVFDGSIPYGEPDTPLKSVILNGVFLPDTEYEVRGRFDPFGGRSTLWSAWLAVTTPDVRLSGFDVYDGVIGFDKLADDVRQYQKWIGEDVRDVINTLLERITSTVDQDLSNYADKQELRREAALTANGITASYTEAIRVAVGPGSALVQRVEALEVEVNDPVTGLEATAQAVDLLETRVDDPETGLEAQATAITALSAATDPNNVATANFRMVVSAGPSGYSSRIGLQARTGGAGSWKAASLFLDVPSSGPTRVTVVADQFVVTDETNVQVPFIFSGGIARMNVAHIGTVTAGLIRSADSKMQIQLDNSRILITD